MATRAEWIHVGADPATVKSAKQISAELSGDGLSFTKAQILRRALALGVDSIKRDPSLMVPGRREET